MQLKIQQRLLIYLFSVFSVLICCSCFLIGTVWRSESM